MELVWFEKNVIVSLRVLLPFFRKYYFYLCALDMNSRDGEYLVFYNSFKKTKISIFLNDSFDIQIERKLGFFLFGKSKSIISLKKEKMKYHSYSELPENFNDEIQLEKLLKDYMEFLEYKFKHILMDKYR